MMSDTFRPLPLVWNGYQIIESPLAVRREFRRVKGGYLNRWLIRVELMVPCIIQLAFPRRTLLVHPAHMPALRAVLRKECERAWT